MLGCLSTSGLSPVGRLYRLGAAAYIFGAAVTDTYAAFLLLRFLTGVCLAEIYPVGMKVVADWASAKTEAQAFGILIACLTIGSAMPLLIRATLPLPWRWVMVTAALFTGFRLRRPRFISFGYIGHM